MSHLHRYNKISETKDGILEVCEICKKPLTIKKGNKELIDNNAYLKEHERDFLQPDDKEFKKEWGKPQY